MQVQLVRNATLVVTLGGTRLLVDPMLDPAGARPPVENTANPMANPLVELLVAAEELVAGADAVLVTHLHQDHFDATAARLIGDRLPVLCQPEDAGTLGERGVTRLTPVETTVEHGGLTITRTPARHGFGAVAEALGPVSGFVLEADGDGPLYIAGDTVFYEEVAAVLERHRPRVVVVNAGGASFLDSERIVMDVDDVLRVTDAAPSSTVVAVHLEAINHCPVTREQLAAATRGRDVVVPQDGETVTPRARAVGINHVALEVADLDEALAFYGRLFAFELRGRIGDRMAFVDMGDQFVALSAGREQPPDDARHFGFVVDDKEAVRRALESNGVPVLGGRGLDFRDPWGNRVQVVQYDEIQFSKTPGVLRGMGAGGLGKTDAALAELREKGLDPIG